VGHRYRRRRRYGFHQACAQSQIPLGHHPHWAKGIPPKFSTINATIEKLTEAASWRGYSSMDTHVIAKISNAFGDANANMASKPFLDPLISSDPAVFPTPDQQKRLVVLTEDTVGQTRAITRIWQKFKTGQ
jgi:hypothetical protein